MNKSILIIVFLGIVLVSGLVYSQDNNLVQCSTCTGSCAITRPYCHSFPLEQLVQDEIAYSFYSDSSCQTSTSSVQYANCTGCVNGVRYQCPDNGSSSSSSDDTNWFSSSSSSTSSKSKFDSKLKYFVTGCGLTVLGGLTTLSLLEEEKQPEPATTTTTTSTPTEESTPTEKKQEPRYEIETFKYVIIGGGTSAYHAVDKILENDKEATIVIIGKEFEVPYKRPPLSKNLWSSTDPDVATKLEYSDWSGTPQQLLYEPESVYGNEVLQFIRTRKVVDMHLEDQIVLLNDGTLIKYDKCLIATGGEPRRLNFTAKDDPNITTYRTVEDFKNLHSIVAKGDKHVTILGGGFLGSELTCAINQNFSKNGVKITQVFPEKGVYQTIFPEYLSKYATEEIRKSGVEVKNEKLVKDVIKNGEKLLVKLDDGSEFETDHVVVSVGIIPNTDVAKSTTLEIDPVNGGYVVNPELQARSNVYVAGDVASIYDFSLGKRRRIEHHDHARATGEHAGINMTGKTLPYTYQPFFWSDLTPNIGFEAVGEIDSTHKTFSVWEKKEDGQENYNKGNIYYINKKNQVVGVLCLGNYGKMDTARDLIKKGKPVVDLNDLQHAISLEDEHH
eukprot:gene8576-10553_t